jgi:hypothetical protein
MMQRPALRSLANASGFHGGRFRSRQIFLGAEMKAVETRVFFEENALIAAGRFPVHFRPPFGFWPSAIQNRSRITEVFFSFLPARVGRKISFATARRAG